VEEGWVVVGLDTGGTCNNATVLHSSGRFLVDSLVETPSRVLEGPEVAIEALAEAFDNVLTLTGTTRQAVRAVGFDTPGPATADGVISRRGATNFSAPEWHGFDFRTGLEGRLGLPVVYNNDGNAAALYAHHAHFGMIASERSSVAAVVGTGLGGGIVESGDVIKGAAGMAGEIGHVHIPLEGLLAPDQPMPLCNCGQHGDAESVASLTGIVKNLLPYWLGRYPDHPLAGLPIEAAAKQVRAYAERGDELAIKVFEQQAMALGRLFSLIANITDPAAYFLGGGVVETQPHLRTWFLDQVKAHTSLREEQAEQATFALVPHLDMAGARGAAIGAVSAVRPF
jgi:predicted NBD/HSP70 family sugar kinase